MSPSARTPEISVTSSRDHARTRKISVTPSRDPDRTPKISVTPSNEGIAMLSFICQLFACFEVSFSLFKLLSFYRIPHMHYLIFMYSITHNGI